MNINTDSFDSGYNIFEELGKGHFAVVKRCVNKKTGTELAGKFIRKKRVCRGVPIEDIKREIETLSCLKHPGIITLHEVYDTGQTMVLLLELVSCGELFDFVSDKGHLTEVQTMHIMQQILHAVEHMHSKNIAHLDLKPENVLLLDRTDFPKIKVIDFGLSQRLDKVTEIKTVFGTPEFVAPEVVNFETLSLATDMWAIGVITYILLSGASPFLGSDKQETYSNVATGSYTFDKEYFQSISSEAKDFIARLLIKEPKHQQNLSSMCSAKELFQTWSQLCHGHVVLKRSSPIYMQSTMATSRKRNTVSEALEHCWMKMRDDCFVLGLFDDNDGLKDCDAEKKQPYFLKKKFENK